MADKKDNQNSGQMSMFDINDSLTQNASEVADVAQNKKVTKSTVRGVKIDENNLPEGTRIVIKPDGRKVLVRKKVVPKDQGQIATATTAEKAAVKSAPAKASAKPVVEEKKADNAAAATVEVRSDKNEVKTAQKAAGKRKAEAKPAADTKAVADKTNEDKAAAQDKAVGEKKDKAVKETAAQEQSEKPQEEKQKELDAKQAQPQEESDVKVADNTPVEEKVNRADKVVDEKKQAQLDAKAEKKAQKLAEKEKEKAQAKQLKEKAKLFKTSEFVHVEAAADIGLNDEQIEERQIRGLTNRQDNTISKSYLKIFTTNIFTLFNLVNIFLASLIIVFSGQIKNMLFAGIALVNLVIGIIQEIRSKRALDKLSLVSAPSIDAVRNGEVVSISTDQIVIDDVIILKQGSQIPTDCIVVGGECEANESLLTGEQDDIHKGIGDQLMSGSFVQAGTCRARVIAVGEDTYAAKLMSEAKKFKKSKSELMRSINWIIRIATVIIFPLGILMFFTNKKYSPSISGAVTSTVSSVIGMIPEGLVMLTSIALALGIIRLAKKRTLVQDLYSIEALARVDVLCLDKTGTITEGTMQVENVHVYSSMFGSPDDIMTNMVKALGANNATFEACDEYFSSNETYKVAKLMPFSSARKWSGASFDGVGTFIVGAPEFVLKERFDSVERNVTEYAMQGYRVLVLVSTTEELKDSQMDPNQMSLIALIVLSDKIRSTAPATFDYFEQQGVELKVISGDSPLTVSKVAERAGLKNAEKYVDASVDLDTPDKIYEAVEKYTVFGRVTPSQKKELVAAIKAHGHTVGMTGDGVNDVMALKEADCSIAMASGSDASRNVAQLVLLDSDFSALPSVVSEGRRVINNIERASSLFLVKTTFSAVLSLLLIIFQFATYPFEPIQLTLINALFVGVPSFILALEPNDRRVKGNFLSKVFKRALPAGLTVAFAIILVCWMYNDKGFDLSPQISTMSVYITASVSFIVLMQVCMPYTKDKIFMLGLLLVAFIFAVSNPFLSEKFSLVTLYPNMMINLVIIIICIIPIMAFMRVEIEAFKALFKETGGFIKREKARAKEFFNRFDNKK